MLNINRKPINTVCLQDPIHLILHIFINCDSNYCNTDFQASVIVFSQSFMKPLMDVSKKPRYLGENKCAINAIGIVNRNSFMQVTKKFAIEGNISTSKY